MKLQWIQNSQNNLLEENKVGGLTFLSTKQVLPMSVLGPFNS